MIQVRVVSRQAVTGGPLGPLYDLDYVPPTAAGYSASRHKLDIFYPSSGSGPWPWVMFVHAGGFTGGDHRTCRTVGHWTRRVFEVNNCVLISAGYRLAPGDPFPAQRYDIGAAIRWVKHHAGVLHLDPLAGGLMPYSAGALIATHVAITADSPTFAHAAFGHTDQSESVRACYAFSGPYRISTEEAQQVTRFGSVVRVVADVSSPEGQLIGNLNPYDTGSGGVAAAATASPYTHVTTAPANACQFALHHGANDTTVVADQSPELAAQLSANGYTATATVHAGEAHNITANATITNAVVDALCTLLTA